MSDDHYEYDDTCVDHGCDSDCHDDDNKHVVDCNAYVDVVGDDNNLA